MCGWSCRSSRTKIFNETETTQLQFETMNTIRCLVVDDEPLALEQMATYVGKTPFLTLVGKCCSAEEASKLISMENVDAMFVDINMPDLNGLDFVRSLVAPLKVVFTTAYSEYAVEGYKVDAVD